MNNRYESSISQKLLVDDFKRRKDKFRNDEEFIDNYDKNSDKKCILEVDAKLKFIAEATQ